MSSTNYINMQSQSVDIEEAENDQTQLLLFGLSSDVHQAKDERASLSNSLLICGVYLFSITNIRSQPTANPINQSINQQNQQDQSCDQSSSRILSHDKNDNQLVENSIGFWYESTLQWFMSLPDEVQIYPFIAKLLHVQPPVEMDIWPHHNHTQHMHHWLPLPELHSDQQDFDQMNHSPYLNFLQNRTFLYLSDSIDRYLIEWLCGLGPSTDNVKPPDWVSIHESFNVIQDSVPYAPSFDPFYGVRICNAQQLNFTIIHSMIMGINRRDIFTPLNLLRNLIPANLTMITHKVAPRLDHMENGVEPDVLFVHSCAWDVTDLALPWLLPDRIAFNYWMKRFETEMLIPALLKFSPRYRAWQRAYIENERQLSGQNATDTARRVFEYDSTADYNSTISELAPTPHSHPMQFELETNPGREPMVMLRSCTPTRDDINDAPMRRAGEMKITRAMRHLSRRYNIKMIDMYSMFNGRQHGGSEHMRDHMHWSFKPIYQSFNIILNMFRQHLVLTEGN